jgi:amino acid transporter
VGDPLAYAFGKLNLTKLSGIIAVSAVIAMASVMLVFQVGQPRIWMSMSRDGLLPPIFSRIHKKYRTPAFSTLLTGVLVAVPSLFLNLTEVTDLTSIGTLFAFVLVSGGVLVLDQTDGSAGSKGKFRVPYLNSRYYLPLIWLVIAGVFLWLDPKFIFVSQLSVNTFALIVFGVFASALTILSVWKKLSLIPVMGLLTNFYLMAQLGITNWMRFIIWLLIGLVIYFLFGRKKSKLKDKTV